MPLFGIDDVIFLLISTSFLILAKRGEIVHGLTSSDEAISPTHDAVYTPSIADSKKENFLRRTFSTTPLLLPCFQFPLDFTSSQSTSKTNSFAKQSIGPSSLIEKSGVLSTFVPEYAPAIPHRQYNMHMNIPQVFSLTSYSKEEVANSIQRFTPSQVSSLFQDMQSEGLWEPVIEISKGIQIANLSVKYLSQANVERAIVTLIQSHHTDQAVDYYFTYGVDMLIGDELLVLLFDDCLSSEERCMKLYRHLVPFRSRWTEVVYCCCITGAAEWAPSLAMELYKAYEAFQKAEQAKNDSPWMRILSSSALLQDSGVIRQRPVSKFRHLYHIMVPLVANYYPDLVFQYVADMKRNQPEVAPDVFLKCILLLNAKKKKNERDRIDALIRDFLFELDEGDHFFPDVASMTTTQVAMSLYQLRPSPMNMNSLVRVLIDREDHKDPDFCVSASSCPSSSSFIPTIPELFLNFQKLLEKVPLENTHARILSRTVTEGKASWALTSVFLHTMLQRQQFSVVPSLVRHLSRLGQWSTAATAMSIYMSNRHSNTAPLSPTEVSLCVEACSKAGKWNSVLFWIQRASNSGSTLTPAVYDTALSACQHMPWEKTAQLIQCIRRSGGTWSEKGYEQLVRNFSRQGRLKHLLRLIPFAKSMSGTQKS